MGRQDMLRERNRSLVKRLQGVFRECGIEVENNATRMGHLSSAILQIIEEREHVKFPRGHFEGTVATEDPNARPAYKDTFVQVVGAVRTLQEERRERIRNRLLPILEHRLGLKPREVNDMTPLDGQSEEIVADAMNEFILDLSQEKFSEKSPLIELVEEIDELLYPEPCSAA